ncbi:helix-turn-helix domain-containing protein [uncultured Algibacter sp.]|uniref:helix-turn-helix domain-containing protein n=1 Tax=uncultured Algibacter sp. TaxID=298659 RepID=UPI0026136592|nr:helix-turn-helix domain-containing protein [uncultured Algibacter sp.]
MIKESKPIVFSFSDITLFHFVNIVRQWDLQFLQLEPGVFSVDLKQFISQDFQLGYGKFNRKVKQEGFSPKGIWTFAFVNAVNLYWRNFKVYLNSVIIYAPGSEINAVSDAGFEVMTISIPDAYLFKIAKRENHLARYSVLKTISLLSGEHPLWQELRASILLEINRRSIKLEEKSNDAYLEVFTLKLLELITHFRISNDEVSSVKRLNLLKKAEAYILKNITEPVTVTRLALYLGVSERTLLYAFRNRFGMGPKAYMKFLKLNHLHVRLHEQKSKASIASIARDSGFWHMGQLYKDYKKFFGELPSETLNGNFK